jgi:hypothetical protein
MSMAFLQEIKVSFVRYILFCSTQKQTTVDSRLSETVGTGAFSDK